MLIRPPKNYFWKNQTIFKKNAEFYADFKTVEKVAKNSCTKSYWQKCNGKMYFSHFYSCSSNWFLYNFLCVHFLQLFHPFWNQHKILRFLYLIWFYSKHIFWGLLSTLSHFLQTLKLNPHRMAQKTENTFSK